MDQMLARIARILDTTIVITLDSKGHRRECVRRIVAVDTGASKDDPDVVSLLLNEPLQMTIGSDFTAPYRANQIHVKLSKNGLDPDAHAIATQDLSRSGGHFVCVVISAFPTA